MTPPVGKLRKTIWWYVYILRCHDGSLYTGITNHLEERIAKHNKGIASKYTRVRRPVVKVYQERKRTKGNALKREYAIKQLTKIEKEKLIR